ncbi:MAG TPA: hypothetical protein VIQ27_15825 [Gemmatimonadales bacterium]|jgi:hypothetical protein
MFGRRQGVLLATLLAFSGVVALRTCRREVASAVWTEVDENDPRVVGVFLTLHRHGLAAALDSLERQSKRDSLVLRAGHQLAHALGRQAVVSEGGSDSVIAQCRASFSSGCYHGVVEASLGDRRAVDMGALEHMCAGAGGIRESASLFECIHGVGHGVLGAVGGDVSRALLDCDGLSSEPLRGSCHEGVFMEAITTAIAGEHHAMHSHGAGDVGGGLTLDPNDPYSPCRQYGDRYGQACWLFQGFLILRRVGFDAGRALDLCDQAPGGWEARCYQSVGHQLTGLFQRDDGWVIDRCRTGRPELGAQCAAGAVLARVAEDWTGSRARRFCGRVPSAWERECEKTYLDRMTALRTRSRSDRS